MNRKLLVLYTEYAGYLDACLKKLIDVFRYEVHVVRYAKDKNAPFRLNSKDHLFFYDRSTLNDAGIWNLFTSIDPDALLVSGWIDSGYNRLIKRIKEEGKMVIGVVDNQWVGSMRQRLFSNVGKFFLSSRFTHFWIPGTTQFEYLRKIGIEPDKIDFGFYCADSDLFNSLYKPYRRIRKRFVYTGRLLKIKGTPELLDAIKLVSTADLNGWEFLIIGNGHYEEDVKKLAVTNRNVIYKSFLQPEELACEVADGGVLVLPSNYDAWGVVVHEFALMGFPLLLSSMVGSRHYFVTPGYNGYYFNAGNYKDLANAMTKFIKASDEQLVKMSERSHLIGSTMTTEAWATRLDENIRSFYS